MKNLSQAQSPLVSSRDLGWESIIVEEFRQPLGTIESGFWQEHTLCLSLTNCFNHIWRVSDNRGYRGLYTKGDFTLIPAELIGSYRAYGDDHYLQLRIPPSFLKQVAGETINTDPDRLEIVTEFRDRHPQIEQLAMMLRAELYRGKDGVGQLYVESLANALVVNLLRDYSSTKPQIRVYEGGLSDRALLKAIEYINEHLNRSIKTQDLAEYIGISQFHFSRLFKKSTGISPHQYVMQQRIERAKQLLTTADLAIADIALNCGFNSQSHLGKYFRQVTGMTPRNYRQSL